MMNMDDAPHDFARSGDDDRSWLVFADTAKASPDDIAEPGQAQAVRRRTVHGRRPQHRDPGVSRQLTDPEEGIDTDGLENALHLLRHDRGVGRLVPGGRGHVHAEDDRRPRVRGRDHQPDLRRGHPQPGRGLHRRTGQMREMLDRGRILFAYGIFYPEGDDTVFEAKHIIFVGRRSQEFVFERPDWWVQQVARDRGLLPQRPVADGERRLLRLPHADHARGRQARRARGRRPTRSRAWSTGSRRRT